VAHRETNGGGTGDLGTGSLSLEDSQSGQVLSDFPGVPYSYGAPALFSPDGTRVLTEVATSAEPVPAIITLGDGGLARIGDAPVDTLAWLSDDLAAWSDGNTLHAWSAVSGPADPGLPHGSWVVPSSTGRLAVATDQGSSLDLISGGQSTPRVLPGYVAGQAAWAPDGATLLLPVRTAAGEALLAISVP
jgi:hypothetical protein